MGVNRLPQTPCPDLSSTISSSCLHSLCGRVCPHQSHYNLLITMDCMIHHVESSLHGESLLTEISNGASDRILVFDTWFVSSLIGVICHNFRAGGPQRQPWTLPPSPASQSDTARSRTTEAGQREGWRAVFGWLNGFWENIFWFTKFSAAVASPALNNNPAPNVFVLVWADDNPLSKNNNSMTWLRY